MKCYTFLNGDIQSGLKVVLNKKLHSYHAIFGEVGCKSATIRLDKYNPAEIEADSLVIEVSPNRIPNGYYVLSKPKEHNIDDEVLLRINTRGEYAPHTHGFCKIEAGSPQRIASARGGNDTWTDDLFILKSGDILRVGERGGSKTATRFVFLDVNGEPLALTKRQFRKYPETVQKA